MHTHDRSIFFKRTSSSRLVQSQDCFWAMLRGNNSLLSWRRAALVLFPSAKSYELSVDKGPTKHKIWRLDGCVALMQFSAITDLHLSWEILCFCCDVNPFFLFASAETIWRGSRVRVLVLLIKFQQGTWGTQQTHNMTLDVVLMHFIAITGFHLSHVATEHITSVVT